LGDERNLVGGFPVGMVRDFGLRYFGTPSLNPQESRWRWRR